MPHKKNILKIFGLAIAMLIALQSCKQIKKQKNTSWKRPKADRVQTDNYLAIADSLIKKSEYTKAYYYYNKATIAAESKNDTSRVVYALINLANLHYSQTDFSESEIIATQALELLKNRKDHYYNFRLYMTLGNIYREIYDYKNAQYYFEKALKFKNLSSLDIDGVENNIASVNIEKKNFDKAVKILQPLITKKNLINNDELYSTLLCNLGYCYYKQVNPKAEEYLKSSLQIRTKINDLGKSLSCIYLSKYYQKRNPKKAYNYAKLGYQTATKMHVQDNRLTCLKQLIRLNSENKIKHYTSIYFTLNDSLIKARQMAKNQFAKIKYDSKQEKEENLKLKAQKAENALELEHQKNRNLLLYFIVVIGFLTTFFLYYFLKAKNKREKIQTSYNTETRIAKKLHDELANDVYNTMTFAETQDLSNIDKKELFLNQIETIYNRTRNISLENSEIDTSEYFKENLLMLISSFNNDKTNIIIKNQDVINWNKTKKITKIAVYRVIQELLVNMKKHSQCSLAVIGFETKGKTIEINYSDNGVGSEKKLKFKNGLQNVENRIKNINGTFTFETELLKGFKAKIIFPH